MPTDLPNLFVPVVATLIGAAVAGYASFLAGRGMRSHDWRLSLIGERMLDFRQLYARFLAESDGFMLLSAGKAAKGLEDLRPMFALFSELSLVASEPVCRSATKMCEAALNSLTAMEEERAYFAAKTDFIRLAREEIGSLEASVRRIN